MKKWVSPAATLLAIVLMFHSTAFTQNDESAHRLYQHAIEQSLAQNWDLAIETFRELIEQYPGSQYQDDSRFWVGYCLEKKPNSQLEAFIAFGELQEKYPESLWVDDAVIHQISLAEYLVRHGEPRFLKLLRDHLDSEDAIREQAALALGKLGDKQALPVLKELADDADLGPLVKPLIENLESGAASLPDITADTTRSGVFGSILNYLTREHRFYKQILKKDDQWSQDELIDYALWLILPASEFAEYFSLDRLQRRKWYLREWKDVDPKPETPENEARLEFERRIQYAREHYAEFWPINKTPYLPDQHQVRGWLNAPWDARGEVYIKYGEPDRREIGNWNPLYTEVWIYYRYDVDFEIHRYMTNVYGQAIHPGEMTMLRYRSSPFTFDDFYSRYVDNKEFYYP